MIVGWLFLITPICANILFSNTELPSNYAMFGNCVGENDAPFSAEIYPFPLNLCTQEELIDDVKVIER